MLKYAANFLRKAHSQVPYKQPDHNDVETDVETDVELIFVTPITLEMPMNSNATTGLILTGGGARAAYQVGVLKAIADILLEDGWAPERNPFGIICGTSAGESC